MHVTIENFFIHIFSLCMCYYGFICVVCWCTQGALYLCTCDCAFSLCLSQGWGEWLPLFVTQCSISHCIRLGDCHAFEILVQPFNRCGFSFFLHDYFVYVLIYEHFACVFYPILLWICWVFGSQLWRLYLFQISNACVLNLNDRLIPILHISWLGISACPGFNILLALLLDLTKSA